jgi:hypothetical protein
MLFRRQPEAASYSSLDPEHVVTLNALNMAKEDILSTRRWEFDLRHDGQLLTKATASSRSVVPTFDYAPALPYLATIEDVLSGEAISDQFRDDTIMRVVLTGVSGFEDTAIRVTKYVPVPSGDTIALLTLPISSVDSINGDCDLIYAEYLLPDTVREVVRASFDQNDISLAQLDPTVQFDECIPSPHLESGQPRVLSVGGFDRETYLGTDAVPDPQLRAIVWPVPDDEYIISYSYYYRHPDLASGTDTWDGIPADIVNDIVWQATSIVKMAIDGDYAASHFADMAQAQASTKHMAYGGSAARRHVVRSWDSGNAFSALREGFPGKVIG